MTMVKVVFYYEYEGKLKKAVLDGRQYHYALTHCRDYNELLAFIETVTKWEDTEEEKVKV